MMVENLFSRAVTKKETDDFFRGNGVYFVRDPDWGVHVHGAHLTGWVEKYLNADQNNGKIFDEAFIEFINSAKENSEDIEHVFSTLSSYFDSRKRGLLYKSKLFNDIDSEGTQAIFCYIKRIESSGILDDVKNEILVHANFIMSKGCRFFKDFVESKLND